ncbi:MAG TPA: molybdate ABC transporter substrate-binding protein [Acidimicrobiales bacterium]|nr:molybdate ABC transporter substrate-binding protein [Acidimicrobiales bacterium]
MARLTSNRRTALATALAAFSVIVVACGSSGSRQGMASNVTSTTAPSATSAGATVTGGLDVFAAASLTGAFSSAKTGLMRANPELDLTYNFAGSNALVTQIQQGAPADVFASADQTNMNKLVTAGLVETPVTFARNKLEIAVAPGNPKHISSLADLAHPGVSVVLEAEGVPAGDYTRSVLSSHHITVSPMSLETDVKAALAKVTSGEADATVVYVTDVRAAGRSVAGVSIPDSLQPDIGYPIAVVKATRNHRAAQAFVDSAVSGEVQEALEAAGFLPPH